VTTSEWGGRGQGPATGGLAEAASQRAEPERRLERLESTKRKSASVTACAGQNRSRSFLSLFLPFLHGRTRLFIHQVESHGNGRRITHRCSIVNQRALSSSLMVSPL